MTIETSSTKNLLVLFGIIAAGAVVFIAVVVFPATELIRETITEEATVIHSSDGQCVVETTDTIFTAKTVSDCDLPVDTTVTVQYQQSMSEASLVRP